MSVADQDAVRDFVDKAIRENLMHRDNLRELLMDAVPDQVGATIGKHLAIR